MRPFQKYTIQCWLGKFVPPTQCSYVARRPLHIHPSALATSRPSSVRIFAIYPHKIPHRHVCVFAWGGWVLLRVRVCVCIYSDPPFANPTPPPPTQFVLYNGGEIEFWDFLQNSGPLPPGTFVCQLCIAGLYWRPMTFFLSDLTFSWLTFVDF